MTRREMLAQMRANLLLDEDSPVWGWAGESEEFVLDNAADDTAQATDCYFAEQITDVVSGQESYCLPKIYKVKSVHVTDATGERVLLERVTASKLRRVLVGASTDNGSPAYVVVADLTRFRVAPVADFDRENALIVSGFAVPSLPKAGHERHQWDREEDECPLPSWSHSAVVLKATANRCRQIAARDRSFFPLMQQYENAWLMACGEVGAQAARLYHSSA